MSFPLRCMARVRAATPTAWVAILLCAATAGLSAFSMPDVGVIMTPDSGQYWSVAAGLLHLDPSALAAHRSFVYPAVLAFHEATGLSNFWSVSLFNIVGLAVLIHRLLARGLPVGAACTATIGLLLVFSEKNLGFTSTYLRESVVIGGTALPLALLFEALWVPRPLAERVAWVAATVFLLYHLKGIYLYPFLVAGPFLLLPLFASDRGRAGLRGFTLATLTAWLIGACVFATNPRNDAQVRNMNLLGMLLNSNLPRVIALNPDLPVDDATRLSFRQMAVAGAIVVESDRQQGARILRADPYEVDAVLKDRFGVSLASDGPALVRAAARAMPGPFARFIAERTWANLLPSWIVPGWGSVCVATYSRDTGLPRATCQPLAWLLATAWVAALPVLATFGLRRATADAAAAVGLLGMSAGLAVLVAMVAYFDFQRLNYVALVFGALSLPLAVSLFRRNGPHNPRSDRTGKPS